MTLEVYTFEDDEINPHYLQKFPIPLHPHPNGEIMQHTMCRLVQEFISLPEPDVQIPWIATYLLMATGMLKAAKSKVPYLFSYGASRSGKSRLAKLAAGISGSTICNSASSPASIRQEIERYHADGRRYFFFLWDDLSKDSLKGSNGGVIFSFLKGGYDASTSMVMVGGKDGEPVMFDTFGLKCFSSVTPLHRLQEFVELSNRMLVIQHEQTEGFLGSDPSDWRWDGFAKSVEEFWSPVGDGYHRFKGYRKIVNQVFKHEDVGKLLGLKKTIWQDLIACSCALRIFESGGSRKDDVLLATHWAEKFALYEGRTYAESSPLQQWLVETIIAIGEHYDHAEEAGKRVHVVPAKKLLEKAMRDYEECLLLAKPSMDEIQGILEPMGYSHARPNVYSKVVSYQRMYS